MGKNWDTVAKGVRVKKHPSRKNGIKPDLYFAVRYQVDGKDKESGLGWSSQGWTQQKAIAEREKLISAAKQGQGIKTSRQAQIEIVRAAELEEQKEKSFDDFFNDSYLPSAKTHKKPKTIHDESILYRNWIKSEIGHLPFSKIKAFNLEKIKKTMTDKGLASRSIQLGIALVRQVWNHARMNEITTDNFPKIKLKKFDNKRLRYFTQEEAAVLLQKLSTRSPQLHDMALLSLHTGARAGEIFSLSWAAVDLSSDVLTVKDSKSGKTRRLHLTGKTKEMLRRRYSGQPGKELVFPDKKGGRIKNISHTFDRTMKDLGFNAGVDDRRDKATFHTLRHTFASWHVQNGTDLYTVKELLGHSTIALTERYSHLRPEGLKQTTKLFDDMEETGGDFQTRLDSIPKKGILSK